MKKLTIVQCKNCGHEFPLKSWGYDKLILSCSFYAVCPECESSFDISDEDAESILIPDGTKVEMYCGKIGIIDGNDFECVDPESDDAYGNVNYYICPIEFTHEEIWSDHYEMLLRTDFEIIND